MIKKTIQTKISSFLGVENEQDIETIIEKLKLKKNTIICFDEMIVVPSQDSELLDWYESYKLVDVKTKKFREFMKFESVILDKYLMTTPVMKYYYLFNVKKKVLIPKRTLDDLAYFLILNHNFDVEINKCIGGELDKFV